MVLRAAGRTWCAVLTADDARDSSGDMGDGALFMIACGNDRGHHPERGVLLQCRQSLTTILADGWIHYIYSPGDVAT